MPLSRRRAKLARWRCNSAPYRCLYNERASANSLIDRIRGRRHTAYCMYRTPRIGPRQGERRWDWIVRRRLPRSCAGYFRAAILARRRSSVPSDREERGEGFRLWDVDANQYIALLNNFTSLVHGHSPPEIVDAVCDQAHLGLSFSAPHRSQGELTERLVDRVIRSSASASPTPGPRRCCRRSDRLRRSPAGSGS